MIVECPLCVVHHPSSTSALKCWMDFDQTCQQCPLYGPSDNCSFILNKGQWFRRRCRLKIIVLAVVVILLRGKGFTSIMEG